MLDWIVNWFSVSDVGCGFGGMWIEFICIVVSWVDVGCLVDCGVCGCFVVVCVYLDW